MATLADLADYFLGSLPEEDRGGMTLADFGRRYIEALTTAGASLDDLTRRVIPPYTTRVDLTPKPFRGEWTTYHAPPTERFGYWAMNTSERLGAERDVQQRVGDMAKGVAQLFVLPSLADAAFYAGRGEPGNTTLAALGTIPGASGAFARAAEKEIGSGIRMARNAAKSTELPMDESARAARTEEMGAASTAQDQLFDLSNLGGVPDVPQFDIPRYAPPRGVPERVVDLTSDPRVRDKMLEVIAVGEKMGGPMWYNTAPLREAFVAELGKTRGEEAFRKYIDFVAATSPRSEVGLNVRNASYYYRRLLSGQGMPAVGEANPHPYGHVAQQWHQMNARRVAGEGLNPLRNPKTASFSENLAGNELPVSVDTHGFRLPAILAEDPRFLVTAFRSNPSAPRQNVRAAVEGGLMGMDEAVKRPAFWQAQPRPNEYGALEQYNKSLAKEVGLSPRDTQASAWIGGAHLTGLASDSTKPFLGFLQDRVMLTAQKTGLDPREVLKRFIRGEMALISVGAGGAVLVGGPELTHPQ